MTRSFSSFLTLETQQQFPTWDFGLISEAHDEAEDWGLITEGVDEILDFSIGRPAATLTPAPGL